MRNRISDPLFLDIAKFINLNFYRNGKILVGEFHYSIFLQLCFRSRVWIVLWRLRFIARVASCVRKKSWKSHTIEKKKYGCMFSCHSKIPYSLNFHRTGEVPVTKHFKFNHLQFFFRCRVQILYRRLRVCGLFTRRTQNKFKNMHYELLVSGSHHSESQNSQFFVGSRPFFRHRVRNFVADDFVFGLASELGIELHGVLFVQCRYMK